MFFKLLVAKLPCEQVVQTFARLLGPGQRFRRASFQRPLAQHSAQPWRVQLVASQPTFRAMPKFIRLPACMAQRNDPGGLLFIARPRGTVRSLGEFFFFELFDLDFWTLSSSCPEIRPALQP